MASTAISPPAIFKIAKIIIQEVFHLRSLEHIEHHLFSIIEIISISSKRINDCFQSIFQQ